MQHVGVREDQVRPLADLPAPLGRRVPVVDRRPDSFDAELGECARLVLCEGFRRIEVERPRLRLTRDRVEHGEVEGERLARSRPGRDDDVLAAVRGFPGLRLVREEPADPVCDERRGEAGLEPVGQRLAAGVAGGLEPAIDDLVVREQALPAGDLDSHSSSVAGRYSAGSSDDPQIAQRMARRGCGRHRSGRRHTASSCDSAFASESTAAPRAKMTARTAIPSCARISRSLCTRSRG